MCISYLHVRFEGLFQLKWYSKVECKGNAYVDHKYIEGKSVKGTAGRRTAIEFALKDFIYEACNLGLISKNDAPNLICYD